MRINLKQPKYVMPLIAFPFLCLMFYGYKSMAGNDKKATPTVKTEDGLQPRVADVSKEISNRKLTDKLDAYTQRYKDGDGYTAVASLEDDSLKSEKLRGEYNAREKRMLDSINEAFKQKAMGRDKGSGAYEQRNGFTTTTGAGTTRRGPMSEEDRQLQLALNNLGKANRKMDDVNAARTGGKAGERQMDPMQMFREQMRIIDSMGKSNDTTGVPQKQQLKNEQMLQAMDQIAARTPKLTVVKADAVDDIFNTVQVKPESNLIRAIIDENVTGFAGSRIRIRLLEDIMVGKFRIPQGTYLYGLISGFSAQRVMLTISSVLIDDKILPIKLQAYDLDGMEGLYVPESAFREFTKQMADLSSLNMQGSRSAEGASMINQMYMSAIDRLFTSTSTAVTGLVRKNKAKIKYSTFIYLIDSEALKENQKNY